MYVIRGCNCPVMIKAISTQLEREHTVLEGKAERSEVWLIEVATNEGYVMEHTPISQQLTYAASLRHIMHNTLSVL